MGTKFVNELSKEVYQETYQFQGNENIGKDEDINGTQRRTAKDLAKLEGDPIHWEEEFVKLQEMFAFVTGGRILSNAGLGLKNTTYINCFVDGFVGEGQDSLNGIFDALKRQGLILASEGGYGFNSDVMRPRGAYIRGIGVQSPGSVDMLDMWDTQSTVITKGSGKKSSKGKMKIRKGAQMVTKSMWHPDIEEFIISKQTPNRLTKFNMSVLADDDFMNAVENHLPWTLEFPDYEACKDEYEKEWDGNIYLWKEKGYPVKVYKTFEDANELWDQVMTSTFNRNEPGILFVTIINKLNNLWYYEYINATNPCGEQLLPIGAVCLLGSLNLTQFVNADGTFDWVKFEYYISIAVRMLDNVNDITYVPLEIQKWNLKNKRRIGLGCMGYGSALLMMKMRYGSEKALEWTDKLMSTLANTAYRASSLLAREKGSFPLFDAEKFLQSKYVQQALNPATQEMIRTYGLRNSHLLSFQPTGNTGVLANNVTGGGEPIFLYDYIRTKIQSYYPEGLFTPNAINFEEKTFLGMLEPTNPWKWVREGDENLLRCEFEGDVYKVDKNRGLLKESVVEDYGVWWLRQKGEWNPDAEWACNTSNLTVDDHINTMKILAKYLDSAMSKTVNLPNDYPYEDFKKLYIDCWKSGVIKGCTTYRDGTMTNVLAAIESKKEESSFEYKDAVKRPNSLPCEIYHVTAKGQRWTVVVGLLENKPYEVFAFLYDGVKLSEGVVKGDLIKEKSGVYTLTHSKGQLFDVASGIRDEDEALSRMISTALRHGSAIDFVVEQLDKSHGTVVSFSKAIARVLRKYAKKIEESQNKIERMCDTGDCRIIHEDGCTKCLTCGQSACK